MMYLYGTPEVLSDSFKIYAISKVGWQQKRW